MPITFQSFVFRAIRFILDERSFTEKCSIWDGIKERHSQRLIIRSKTPRPRMLLSRNEKLNYPQKYFIADKRITLTWNCMFKKLYRDMLLLNGDISRAPHATFCTHERFPNKTILNIVLSALDLTGCRIQS